MKIAVVNEAKLVSNAQAAQMTAACQLQLDSHAAPLWDRLPPSMAFYSDVAQVPQDAALLVLFDQPDDPNALGYHLEGADARPTGKVFAAPVLDNGGGVLDGGSSGTSVASVLSHEAIELWADPDVNDWCDGPTTPNGSSYAKELCDPVEANGYEVTLPDGTKVLVSNFVTPAWFDEMAPAGSMFDYMGICGKSFTLAPGGYMIVRNAPGSEQQVFGAKAPPAWRLHLKRKPTSRTGRRMGAEG